MNIAKGDFSGSVVTIGALARQLQKAAAHSNETAQVYEIATNIMLECQRIRESTQFEARPKTIADYIRKFVK